MNFVYIMIYVGIVVVLDEFKLLMLIFSDNFFNIYIKCDGKFVNFEQVVMEFEKDMVSYGFSFVCLFGDFDGIMVQF